MTLEIEILCPYLSNESLAKILDEVLRSCPVRAGGGRGIVMASKRRGVASWIVEDG